VPSFRYFLAPPENMSALSKFPQLCVFCGKRSRAFDLKRSFPERQGFGCPDCLQEGRFSFDHDTEIGLVTNDGRVLLMGIDSDNEADFLVPFRDAAEKIGMSEARLRELQHTPAFSFLNIGIWKVCCGDFMAYLGDWQPENFANRDDFVEAMSQQSDFSTIQWLWPEDETAPHFGEMLIHVFLCLHCNRLRAQEDYS
jgi:uncharacterized protein CbrC (UPF0167 family)